jgi:flagellar hook assembly protein FlgD
MKTFVKIFLVIVVLIALASAVFAAPVKIKKDTSAVTLTLTHYKDLLILRADKSFIGAVVEIHDAAGKLVATSELHKKKMIVDFYDIPYGSYTIQVVKNNEKKEFKYTKKQDSGILN